jgi:hypothetical protein
MTKRKLYALIAKAALAMEELTKSMEAMHSTMRSLTRLNDVMAQHIIELQARVIMVERYNRINTN